MVSLGRLGCKAGLVVWVVLVDEVQQDGTGLPQCRVRVWVMDCGQPAVGVDSQEFGRLDVAEGVGHDLVGGAEFSEDDGDFWRVGTA